MSEQENVQTVQDLYAAFDRGDIQAILDPLVEDVDWGFDNVANDEVPWYGISKGPEAVRDDFFSPIAEEVDIQVFDRKEFIASGNHVAVTYNGEYTLKKNGKKVIHQGMHFWTFDDNGKIVRYRGFEDTAALLAAWRS